MPNFARRFAAPVLAFAALSLTGAAQAQDSAPAAGPSKNAPHGWDPAQMRARMQARRDARLHVLHDALGLRADQEAAWQTFATDSARPHDGARRDHRRGDDVALTTPERLDRMALRMGEKQAQLQRRAQSVKRFYAALDARQQKTFDALVAMRDHRMGGMREGFHDRG